MFNLNNNNLYSKILFFVLLSFYSTFLIIEQRNYFYNAPLVCILMGIAWFYIDVKKDKFDKRYLPIDVIVAFAFYTLSSLSIFVIRPEQFHLFKPDLAPLLAIPIIYALYSSSITSKQITWVFAIGAIVVCLVGIHDKFILNLPRALIERQPVIHAGAAAMVLGLFALNTATLYRRKSSEFLFFIIAALLGITCSFLTGSRGAWLPLFIMVWVFVYKLSRGRWHWFMIFAVSFMALVIVVYLIPQTGVQLRVAQAYIDLNQYFSGGSKVTSVGLRLEFWKSALDGFIERPFLGWGEQYQELKNHQLADGLIVKQAANAHYTHSHNQFLENMVRKGLLGLFALLALLFVPLRFYLSALKNSTSAEVKLLAELGIILVISACLFSLTDVFLGVQLGMLFYVFTNAILVGLISRDIGVK